MRISERRTATGIAAAAIAIATLCTDVAVASGRGTAPVAARRHLAGSPRLLGDPAGLRGWLERHGCVVDLFLNDQLGVLLRDGEHGLARNSGSADLFLRADLARAGVPFGGEILAQLKSNVGRNVNDQAGALGEPIDDADFDAPLWVDQLWYERGFADGRLRLRLGYLDQQVVFDRTAYANSEDRQFLNTFLDNSAIVPLEIGLGALVVAAPTRWLEIAIGAADADNPVRTLGLDSAFDGVRSLTTNVEATLRGELLPGRGGALRVGFFRDGAERIAFGDESPDRGHWGVYVSADQEVWRGDGPFAPALGVFVRAGRADGRVQEIEGFWSVGLQLTGPLPGRPADVLGLGSYQTLPSDDHRARIGADVDRETGVELYYRLQLAPWLAVTPDAQWLHHPGGTSDAPDAFVLALRVRVEL